MEDRRDKPQRFMDECRPFLNVQERPPRPAPRLLSLSLSCSLCHQPAYYRGPVTSQPCASLSHGSGSSQGGAGAGREAEGPASGMAGGTQRIPRREKGRPPRLPTTHLPPHAPRSWRCPPPRRAPRRRRRRCAPPRGSRATSAPPPPASHARATSDQAQAQGARWKAGGCSGGVGGDNSQWVILCGERGVPGRRWGGRPSRWSRYTARLGGRGRLRALAPPRASRVGPSTPASRAAPGAGPRAALRSTPPQPEASGHGAGDAVAVAMRFWGLVRRPGSGRAGGRAGGRARLLRASAKAAHKEGPGPRALAVERVQPRRRPCTRPRRPPGEPPACGSVRWLRA